MAKRKTKPKRKKRGMSKSTMSNLQRSRSLKEFMFRQMVMRLKKEEVNTYNKTRKLGFSEKESLKLLAMQRMLKQEKKKRRKK